MSDLPTFHQEKFPTLQVSVQLLDIHTCASEYWGGI